MPTRRLSLRLKLTAWFLLIFAIIEVSLGLGGIALRIDGLRAEFDRMLLEHAGKLASELSERPTPWLPDDLETIGVFREQRVFVGRYALQIRDVSGAIVAGTENGALQIPDGFLVRAAEAGGPVFTTIDAPPSPMRAGSAERGAGSWRVVSVPIRVEAAAGDGAGGDGAGRRSPQRLIAATTDHLLRSSEREAWAVFLVHMLIGLLAAWVAGWLIAGRAVAPFGRLADAARDLSPASLDERFDSDGHDEEIARLEGELNDALARIEEGYEAQEAFISNISHEIQTPVSVVLAQSQLMKSRDVTEAERDQYVASVEEEMRRLGRLVDAFLTLARAGHGKNLTSSAKVYLRDVIVDSMQECHPLAKQSELRLVPIIPPPEEDEEDLCIKGDTDLLRTMIDNLVRNAIRFSSLGGRIDVGLEKVGETARISVRDYGEGIPPEHIETIFDRFRQGPNGSVRMGGFGLGLAIARNVAELHEGDIEVRNCEEGGCCFTVSLPLPRRAVSNAGLAAREDCLSSE